MDGVVVYQWRMCVASLLLVFRKDGTILFWVCIWIYVAWRLCSHATLTHCFVWVAEFKFTNPSNLVVSFLVYCARCLFVRICQRCMLGKHISTWANVWLRVCVCGVYVHFGVGRRKLVYVALLCLITIGIGSDLEWHFAVRLLFVVRVWAKLFRGEVDFSPFDFGGCRLIAINCQPVRDYYRVD